MSLIFKNSAFVIFTFPGDVWVTVRVKKHQLLSRTKMIYPSFSKVKKASLVMSQDELYKHLFVVLGREAEEDLLGLY